MQPRTLSSTLVALVFAGAAARADVDVLGKPHLGSFSSIQAAVDAAGQGDVLLVGAGTYGGFVIHNKGLTVMALPGAEVEIDGWCEIRNLGPARTASLVGLRTLGPSYWQVQPGLRLVDNLGVVRLQGCTFVGTRSSQSFGSPASGAGALVTRSSKVVFTRCMLFGRDLGLYSGEMPRAGGPGLESEESQIALYECLVRGGRGSEESYPAGGAGGAGCRVSGWGVFASGTTIEGGRGGGGDYIGCTTSGAGGHGLMLTDATAQLYDTDIVRGAAGQFYTCSPGMGGRKLVLNNGTVNDFNTAHRSLGGPLETVDNFTLWLNVQGRPGDSVELLVSDRPVFTFLEEFSGVSTLPQPWSPMPVGTIDASGSLSVPHFIADQTWPQAGRVLWYQAVMTDTQQRRFLSTPIQVLVRNT